MVIVTILRCYINQICISSLVWLVRAISSAHVIALIVRLSNLQPDSSCWKLSRRSSMYILYRSALSMPPCLTPWKIGNSSESSFIHLMQAFVLWWRSSMRDHDAGFIPVRYTFLSNIFRTTRSKADFASNKTKTKPEDLHLYIHGILPRVQ